MSDTSRSSDHFQVALTAAGMHTWTWDIATNAVVWSDGIEALVGLPPGTFGGTFEGYQKVLHADDRAKVLAAIERALADEAFTYEIEHRAYLPDGKLRWLACRGKVYRDPAGAPVQMLGVVWDITARKADEARIEELQAQLLHADRLSAIGRLAGGVAHEINNPMAYVMLNLELADRKLEGMRRDEETAAVRAAIADARDGSERVRRIVRGLGAFSRGDDEPITAVDVHQALDAAIKITENKIRHLARLTKVYGASRAARANEFRLVQVFVNLLVNAADALADGNADTDVVRVETSLGASGVEITVSDSGPGVPDAVRARVFDPFFSTKPIGTGTGLGLSICQTIVGGFGGTIVLDSPRGRGATFRVTLPFADRGHDAARASVTAAPPVRRARLLIVDDETAIARALARVLVAHDVTVAETGREARELCASGTFDCVLCDVMMPDLSGPDLHDELRKDGRGLEQRIVFMTGGAFAPREKAFLASVPNACVEKPFELGALEAALRSVLEREHDLGAQAAR